MAKMQTLTVNGQQFVVDDASALQTEYDDGTFPKAGTVPVANGEGSESWEPIPGKIGELENLDTDAKENLVAAINEVLMMANAGGGDDYLGVDPITSTEEDTPTKWIELGAGYAFITAAKGAINGYPSSYDGFIKSYVSASTVYQTLYVLTNYGTSYHRAGSVKAGWFEEGWDKEFNSNEIIPVKNGSTGRASVTAGSYLVGNGTSAMQEKTPAEVLADIGASPTGFGYDGTALPKVLVTDSTDKTTWATKADALLATLPAYGAMQIAAVDYGNGLLYITYGTLYKYSDQSGGFFGDGGAGILRRRKSGGSWGGWEKMFGQTSTIPLSNLGVTATADELNYMAGVTGNVQDQIDLLSSDKANASDVFMLASGTSIKSGTDLDTITTYGNYKCTSPTVAATLYNCPVTSYFTMRVGSTAPGVDYAGDGDEDYLYQEITLPTGMKWYRNGAPVAASDGTDVVSWRNWIPQISEVLDSTAELGETEHLRKINAFLVEMNNEAQRLGMTNSTFVTPSGLCSKPVKYDSANYSKAWNSYTTAYDLLRLLIAARHTPIVLNAMSTVKRGCIVSGAAKTLTNSVLESSSYNAWAAECGYTILAAKGGSLGGSYGEIGSNGIYNMALLIQDNNEGYEGAVYGVSIMGVESGEAALARTLANDLIVCLKTGTVSADIDSASNRTYPVGMAVVKLTDSGTFDEDIAELANGKFFNADTVRVAASVTKILTAIVCAGRLGPRLCTISANDKVGGSDDYLSADDVLSVADAFYYMLMISSNTTATLLARECSSAMGWKPDPVYELIETITVSEAAAITRTEEPDGTPYKFDAILVLCTTQESWDGTHFYFDCNGATVGGYWGDQGANIPSIYRADKEYGYWKTTWRRSWAYTPQVADKWAFVRRVSDYPHITKFYTGTVPAGTALKIYGVRAR